MTTLSIPASTDAATLQEIKDKKDKPRLDRSKITTYMHEAIATEFRNVPRRYKTLEEMCESFKAQRNLIYSDALKRRSDVKRRMARILEIIKMHSVKYLGISTLKEETLRDLYIKMFGETLTVVTIGKILRDLRKYGFLSTIATKRKNGQQGANITILEPFKRNKILKNNDTSGKKRSIIDKLLDEAANYMKNTPGNEEVPNKPNFHIPEALYQKIDKFSTYKSSISLKAHPSRDKEHKERRTTAISKPSKLLNLVPKYFQEQIRCITTQGKAVLEYWRVGNYVVNKVFNGKVSEEEMQDILQTAVRAFFKKMKAASRGVFEIRNPYGYLNAIVEAEATAYLRRRAHESTPHLYDWLSDSE